MGDFGRQLRGDKQAMPLQWRNQLRQSLEELKVAGRFPAPSSDGCRKPVLGVCEAWCVPPPPPHTHTHTHTHRASFPAPSSKGCRKPVLGVSEAWSFYTPTSELPFPAPSDVVNQCLEFASNPRVTATVGWLRHSQAHLYLFFRECTAGKRSLKEYLST